MEKFGEDEVNGVYDNTPRTNVFGVDEETLLDYLEDSDFLCIMVEGSKEYIMLATIAHCITMLPTSLEYPLV